TQVITLDVDRVMAENVMWARDHRSTAKKVVYWAHNEHVTKTKRTSFASRSPAGEILRVTLGGDYVSVGSATWSGTFLIESRIDFTTVFAATLLGAGPDTYESFFHASRDAAIIVPLR